MENLLFSKVYKVLKKVNFFKLPCFGVWKNRQDLKNSAKWVSDLRKKQSFRNK